MTDDDSSDGGRLPRDANAHLIAAALRMLAQLEKDWVRFVGYAQYARDSGWPNTADEFERFAREVRATIDEAT